jgi:hypothetical protein
MAGMVVGGHWQVNGGAEDFWNRRSAGATDGCFGRIDAFFLRANAEDWFPVP